jgi:hypothetical protein
MPSTAYSAFLAVKVKLLTEDSAGGIVGVEVIEG